MKSGDEEVVEVKDKSVFAREREKDEIKSGKWVNGLKGGWRWHSLKESEREKEGEIKRWRGLLYKERCRRV